MNVKEAYNNWAKQYDSNNNKTRDLEAISLRSTLANIPFHYCLEIGCGTAKNTEWLMQKAMQVTAIDLSEEMLAKAKQKITDNHVQFIQADILNDWAFAKNQYDLVTFSLVLEHIENLNDIFKKVAQVTIKNGLVYIGELHPFKQYTGTKARFDTDEGQQIVTCYNHHISDFIAAAKNNDFKILAIEEFFDDDDKTTIPRILTILFQKN